MSLVQCRFDYACCVWYNSLNQNLKSKLQTTQNKMVRLVLDLDPRSHIDSQHFQQLNWLPSDKRVDHLMLCQVFKIRNNTAPMYMREYFVPQDSLHSHNTRLRNKGGYCLPKIKGSGSKSFCFLGAKLWNELPSDITKLSKLTDFKKASKKFLLNSI